MAKQTSRTIVGIGIILLGIFFLLDSLHIFGNLEDFFLGGAFAAIGSVFLFFYLTNRKLWGLLFPGFSLIGVGGLIFLDSLRIPYLEEASFLMFCISLAFWVVFATEKMHWWAAIPAGVLTTIAFSIQVDNVIRGDSFLFIMFLGFGLTFGLLWTIRKEAPTAWAIWPAMGLTGFALLFPIFEYFDQLWPLILVFVGGSMLFKSLKHREPKAVAPNGNGEETIA